MGHYHPSAKRGQFIEGLPSYGYVYLLVNAEDTDRDPPAVAGSHVKIGGSDVFVRRMKSILVPIDWERSVVLRFPDWRYAYGAEIMLQNMAGRHRDPSFLVLSPYNQEHRYREGMAGQTEWFGINAFDMVMNKLSDPAFRAATQFSRIVPASEVMPGPERPDPLSEDERSRSQADARAVIDDMGQHGGGLIVTSRPSPTNDDFQVLLALPDDMIARGLIQKAQQQYLRFVDGRETPLLGDVIALPGTGLLACPVPILQPNFIERSRESPGMVECHLKFLALPPIDGLPADSVKHVRAATQMGDEAMVNGHVPMQRRYNRWHAPDNTGLMFPESEIVAAAPARTIKPAAVPQPVKPLVGPVQDSLFDDPRLL